MMPLGIYMAMDFLWSKIKEDRTKKKVLFIDEWWKLAYNPIAAAYSMEIARVIRAYRGAIVFATQQMSDILAIDNGQFGTKVLNNCHIKILMKMEETAQESTAATAPTIGPSKYAAIMVPQIFKYAGQLVL